MTLGAFYHLVLVFGLFSEGQTSVIEAQQEVWAAAGEDADLSCQLLETQGVETVIVQVTWQKNEHENVGSYNQMFGHTVNQEFRDKVEFREAGEKNSSIVFRNVTQEDGGCYWCRFTTFPDGGLSGNTCLHVYELHGPVLHIREPWSPEEAGVWCSATGRPAPTVTLTVTQHHLSFSQHNTTRVHNNNNTVTVTTTAVLSGLHDDSTQVGCVVGVASGAQVQVFQRIPDYNDAPRASNVTWMMIVSVSIVTSLQL